MSLSASLAAVHPVTVVRQRRPGDCGIAALTAFVSTIRKVSYGDVAAAARRALGPDWTVRDGLLVRDIEKIAAELGVTLRRIHRKADYLARPVGILGVLFANARAGTYRRNGHWVVIKDGAIIDGDGGKVWSVADYMVNMNARPCTLLVLDS